MFPLYFCYINELKRGDLDMKNEMLQERNRYALIGVIMIIIGLLFLLYIGSSLVCSTKKYANRVENVMFRTK